MRVEIHYGEHLPSVAVQIEARIKITGKNILLLQKKYSKICTKLVIVKKEELKNKHNKTARIKTMKVEHIVLGDRMILIYLQAH